MISRLPSDVPVRSISLPFIHPSISVSPEARTNPFYTAQQVKNALTCRCRSFLECCPWWTSYSSPTGVVLDQKGRYQAKHFHPISAATRCELSMIVTNGIVRMRHNNKKRETRGTSIRRMAGVVGQSPNRHHCLEYRSSRLKSLREDGKRIWAF